MNTREVYKEKFQKAMERLNPAQREAVETIDGPVVVIAGPGTGKTQILTLRIANILNTLGAEFAPNILALTFTNAGVRAMRKRLIEFIGVELAYEVNIFTFHSFAEEMIRSYPDFFPWFISARPISELEKMTIIEKILEKEEWKVLKTFSSDFHHARSIIKAIDDLKSEAISPDDFEESLKDVRERFIASKGEEAFYKRNGKTKNGRVYQKGDLKPSVEEDAEKQFERQRELLAIYRLYQEELKKRRLYDYSDMILSVVKEAEQNSDFLQRLQEQYFYLLVDEHQDTNSAQNRLVELIGEAEVNEGKPNIFTVGDEKQAIYRFQGADEANFLRFKEKYAEVKLIHLEENYRSSQSILDAAHSLLSSNVKLKASHPEVKNLPEKVRVIELENRKGELLTLAQEIEKKIAEGVDPKEIAVFYRNNKEVNDIKTILEKFQIPFVINSRENILNNREIQKFLSLMSVIENPLDNATLARVLFTDFLQLKSFDVIRILDRFSYKKGRTHFRSLIDILSSKKVMEEIGVEDSQSFFNFAHFLEEMKREAENNDFLIFFERLLHQSGFLKHILSQPDSISALSRLEKLFDEVRVQGERVDDYHLSDFLNFIHILKEYNISLEVGKNDLVEGVNLMTAHGSKGLEFSYVFITNAIDENWGGGRKKTQLFFLPTSRVQGTIEDERRLFYVALTRAKRGATILWSRVTNSGKEVEVSRFVREIDPEHIEYLIPDIDSFEEVLIRYFGERETQVLSLFDKEYIRKRFLEQPLSVSALNNYFQSPVVYFFRNLIRIPSTQTKSLIFGNIIHRTLERYFNLGKKEGRTPTKEELLSLFQESMGYFAIPKEMVKDIERHGHEVLEAYFDYYHETFQFTVETERKIYTEMELKNGERLKLYGIVDKMEMMDGGAIRVVDYKTGKTLKEKSDKKQKEALERQLVFYKFLIDRFYGEDRVKETMLDFVEKSKKYGFMRETRNPSEKEVEALREQIELFAEDILNGTFLERNYTREDVGNDEYYELWNELLRRR